MARLSTGMRTSESSDDRCMPLWADIIDKGRLVSVKCQHGHAYGCYSILEWAGSTIESTIGRNQRALTQPIAIAAIAR
jgi:hypothetical protein